MPVDATESGSSGDMVLDFRYLPTATKNKFVCLTIKCVYIYICIYHMSYIILYIFSYIIQPRFTLDVPISCEVFTQGLRAFQVPR